MVSAGRWRQLRGYCVPRPHPRTYLTPITLCAAAGPSRSLVQKYYNDETYYMQLDSHHRFAQGWDRALVKHLEGLRRSTKKPVISQYLNNYGANWTSDRIEKEFVEARSMRLTAKFFDLPNFDQKRTEGLVPYVDYDPYPLKTR